jgi:Pvc16 N-terminal domain
MASTDAIAATTDAIRALLDGAAKESPTFSGITVSIYQSDDLQEALKADTTAMLSVLLHRISLSPNRRNVPVRTGPHGERYRPAIPVDLYYLVTAWAGEARTSQRLLGWAVRVLEDTPVLPSALLNDNGWDGTFYPDETVELTWAPLSMQEEYDMWQVAQNNQQPSASYVARTVAIESTRIVPEYALVQTTEWDYDPEGPNRGRS